MNRTAITVCGKIIDRKDKDKLGREIVVNEKSELYKLPIAHYPLTWETEPEGLAATLISGEHECEASFHRFPKEARGGEHVYIGSATRRLHDTSQSALFRSFLQQAGVFTPGTQVNLNFQKCGNVIRVYFPGPCSATTKS